MTETNDRTCVRCGISEDTTALERCKICYKHFCSDCAFRGIGQRFCSERCSLEYIYGDEGEDDDGFDPTADY